MSALSKRIARLEQATPEGPRTALVLVHGEGFDPDSLTGVDGIDLCREAGESASAFLARLDAYLRATRGRALPLISYARYCDADMPDAPAEMSQTQRVESQSPGFAI